MTQSEQNPPNSEHPFLNDRQAGPFKIIRVLHPSNTAISCLARIANPNTDRAADDRFVLKFFRLHGNRRHREAFEREKQILQRFELPTLASYCGSGVLEPEGMPFIATKYWDKSLPITSYCKQRQVSINGRAALFRQVCETVSFLHRNLIIHCDLKPSHILVNPSGKICIIDFGSAISNAEKTMGWKSGKRPNQVTLAYASPEQLLGKAVTTAADIYALGVILRELICGGETPPPDALTLEKATLFFANRPWMKPSKKIRQWQKNHPETLKQHCQQCQCTPKRLTKHLSSDLDAILSGALAKNPAQRTVSADDLADQLQDFLQHRPVRGKTGFVYTARKAIYRHRLLCTLTVIFFSLLLGWWQLNRYQTAKSLAEKKQTEAVSHFFSQVYEITASKSGSKTPTARDLLDTAKNQLQSQRKINWNIRSKLLHTLAHSYAKTGFYPQSIQLWQEMIAEQKSRFGCSSLKTAASHTDLALTQMQAGDYLQAKARLNLVKKIYHHHQLSDDAVPFQIWRALAFVTGIEGHYGEAEKMMAQKLNRLDVNSGRNATRFIEASLALASIYDTKGQEEKAVALAHGAYKTAVTSFGENSLKAGMSLHKYAILFGESGDKQQTAFLLEESLALIKLFGGKTHPAYSDALISTAGFLLMNGRMSRAMQMVKEAKASRGQIQEDHVFNSAYYFFHKMPSVATQTMGKPVSDAVIDKILKIEKQGTPFRTHAMKLVMGYQLFLENRFEEAENQFDEAASFYKEHAPKKQALITALECLQGITLAMLQQFAQAEELLQCRLLHSTAAWHHRPHEVMLSHMALFILYHEWQKPQQAAVHGLQFMSIFNSLGPDFHQLYREVAQNTLIGRPPSSTRSLPQPAKPR